MYVPFYQVGIACYISSSYGDWDVLLLATEFALNLICSDSTKHSPLFVLYDSQPVLFFEHAICFLIDASVASVANCV